MEEFWIERSTHPVLKGKLFLRSNSGHCHSKSSVIRLLESEAFRKYNPHLISIFQDALAMMESGMIMGPIIKDYSKN